ncbi:MAG: effector, partial [Pigeon pea little leaf phytoplasma]|nr:effector [Pigeon pea little leaf phytoplasma]
MNQKKFLQKYFVEIMIILFVGIVIIIMINKNRHFTSKNQSTLSSSESEKETLESEEAEIEKPLSNRPKRSLETSQLKIKTTLTRLEQIKTYLFTEPINPALLPTDLSEREQEKIAELKKSWQSSLDLLKYEKNIINEKQKECDEHQSQLNSLLSQIESFKKQKTPLEEQQ